jgi:hypothetical protein
LNKRIDQCDFPGCEQPAIAQSVGGVQSCYSHSFSQWWHEAQGTPPMDYEKLLAAMLKMVPVPQTRIERLVHTIVRGSPPLYQLAAQEMHGYEKSYARYVFTIASAIDEVLAEHDRLFKDSTSERAS